jgi:NitT/TauT family transport system permease protein
MFMAVILITLLGMLLYGIVMLLDHWFVAKDARVS